MRLRQQINGQDGEQKQHRKTAQYARHRASSDHAARAERRFILLAKSERTNFHSLRNCSLLSRDFAGLDFTTENRERAEKR
jgi:hypothetical protein